MTKEEKDIIQGVKNVIEEIEDEAICCRYGDMFNWQREKLSREELFDFAKEMRKKFIKDIRSCNGFKIRGVEKD